MNALLDRNLVLTGASSGIGAALARRAVALGATVVGIARTRQALERLREELGPRFHPLICDLAQPSARAETCGYIVELMPRIDALINNAAECVYASPLTMDLDRWHALLEVNLWAATDLVQRLVDRMPRGSRIVNMASVTTRFLANPRFSPYALSKAALEHLTSALRLELASRGIGVSLMLPGLVDTPIYDRIEGFDAARVKLHEQVQHWLEPEDVAEAVVWMLTCPEHVVVGEITLLPRGQAR